MAVVKDNYGPDETAIGKLKHLVIDGLPAATWPVTLAEDAALTDDVVAGTVLGKITASGKYAPYDDTADDGTEDAVCILAQDANVSTGDRYVTAYMMGEFREGALTGIDANGKADLLANKIFVRG